MPKNKRIYHRTYKVGINTDNEKVCIMYGNNIVRTIELRAWNDGVEISIDVYDMHTYVLFQYSVDNKVLFRDKCTKVLINGFDVLEEWWGIW